MSNSQKHGKTFEDSLKSGFPGAADTGRSSTVGFDIEAKFDKEKQFPTSIKTTQNNLVGLADARRTFDTQEDFRLLVGSYDQVGRRKRLHTVHEFCITADEWARLKGNLPSSEVQALHEGLKTFGIGRHEEGRVWAQAQKKRLAEQYHSSFSLNPKIDSKTQRRLQASIGLKVLQEGVKDYTAHTDTYRDLCLPLTIVSTPRGQK